MIRRTWAMHSRAVVVIIAALILDLGLGLAFARAEHLSWFTGIYWAVATATTVGYGDIAATTGPGRVIAVVVMLTVVPLFAASVSIFTASLTAAHIRRHLRHRDAQEPPAQQGEGPQARRG